MLIYVAGPFNAPNALERHRNTLRALDVGRVILAANHVPYVPHAALGAYYGLISEDQAMHACLEMLALCDAMVLLPGWEDSWGSRREAQASARAGRWITDRPSDYADAASVRAWIDDCRQGRRLPWSMTGGAL